MLIAYIVRPDLIDVVLPATDHVVMPSTPQNSALIVNSSATVDTSFTKLRLYGELHDLRNGDSLVFGLVFMAGLIGVTVSLIYAVIRGQPKYMMPFFCVQLLDIGVSGMAMLSYFSSVQELKRWIAEQEYLPSKQAILRLSDDHLMVATLVIFVAVIFCKMYFIGVVWACYKYLQHYARIENFSFRRYNTDALNNIEDAEMLLPPKYEDAIMLPNPQQLIDSPPPPAYTDD